MNNKILIGSIIAVSILVGLSLTSVVGYQGVEYSLKESPLFNVRSGRAINEDSGEFFYDYVGNGNTSNLLIPDRDKEEVSMQRLIDKIIKMDDETFNQLINLIINKVKQDNKFKNEIDETAMIDLFKLRNNPQIINKNYDKQDTTFEPIPTICWFPFCFILYISAWIYMIWRSINSKTNILSYCVCLFD